MRACCFALLLTLPACSSAFADEGDAIAAAQRRLEMAQLKLRLYEQDEFPRQLGHVERAIKLQRAKIESFRRRVREFEQLDTPQNSLRLIAALEDARLDLVAAELCLHELEDERFLLIRSRADRTRLLQFEIEASVESYNAVVRSL
jgi:hypothetical protein